jgi:hypothetical protein
MAASPRRPCPTALTAIGSPWRAKYHSSRSNVVHQLFHDPGADLSGVVAPAARARAAGKAEQGHHGRGDVAEVARFDQRLDGAPLVRQAKLVADGEDAPRAPRGGDQPVAALQRRCQRLLQQDVLAGLQRRQADLGVQGVGHDDVDDVHVPARQQLAVVPVHRHAGEVVRRRGGRLRGAAGDGGQRRARGLGDRAGVMATPEAVADQPEAQAHPLRAPETRPRTTYFCSRSTSSSVGARPSRQMAIISVKNTK